MPKCPHCPHRATGKSCPALTRPAPRFCEVLDPCHPLHKTAFVDALLDAPDAIEEDQAAPGRRRRDVLLEAYLTSWQGYGQHAEWIGRGLEALGHPLDFIDAGTSHEYLARSSWVEDRIVPRESDHPWRMILATPTHTVPATPTVRFTMWETSRISAESVSQLNRAQLVIVPCVQNRDCFRDSGVLPPIEVCGLGIDPTIYFDDGSRPRTDRVVFGMAGRTKHGGIRKGINEGIKAFTDAFPPSVLDVELQIKLSEDCVPDLDVPDDPRIRLVTQVVSNEEMPAWYRQLSCLLVPSKGEGWGFHTQQAMACARPVIAAPWSGTVEFWDPSCGWSLDYDLVPAGEFYAMPGAKWAVPRHASMVEALRAAYHDRDQLAPRGQIAAAKAAPFTWDRHARTLRGILQRYGYLPASTADRLALVAQCPDRGSVLPVSLQPACGCAELTECRRGRGKRPGSVTLADCLACVTTRDTRSKLIAETNHLASVGHDIYVGNYQACDESLDSFPLSIHIQRNRDADRRCKRFLTGTGPGLVVSWREEEPLDKLSVSLDEIRAYAKQPGELIVHCHGGVCRSTQLALVCKIARGCDPYTAIGDIHRGLKADRNTAVLWNLENVKAILDQSF